MKQIFLQLVYGRSQTAFSKEGLPIGASLEDLGKYRYSQVGTAFSTEQKGVRYMQTVEGYTLSLALDVNDEVIGYKFINTASMLSKIKKGIPPDIAYKESIGTYGRFEEASKYIDPREE